MVFTKRIIKKKGTHFSILFLEKEKGKFKLIQDKIILQYEENTDRRINN